MNEQLEIISKRFEELIPELEKALKHCKTAATHFKSKEVPRGCAHAVALQGHLLIANEWLEEFAKIHREHAH